MRTRAVFPIIGIVGLIGAAEAELVVYPREGHVPLEWAHALDAINRTQALFDRYLVGSRFRAADRETL